MGCESVIKTSSFKKIIIILDSTHTTHHVLTELRAYWELVCVGSYIIVSDTVVDFLESVDPGKPYSKENNPKHAVEAFLKENDRFRIEKYWNLKCLITHNQDGYLYRFK